MVDLIIFVSLSLFTFQIMLKPQERIISKPGMSLIIFFIKEASCLSIFLCI